ncbi:esterase/lipase family protein [Thermomonas carbonis]|uniref:Alpha/beta hydrolase n=2 Tax=Thermomonas carbonis TaxID=1463158 RepID=A0A7G9SPB9_9GAMM|nr:alpha/beta hydrolase [Thermomonas carbonis]QNN69694.1 alpha/beta hydrolase [Thermomonas carbonis]GHB94880.1 permease [Thermomonas carbonis]
MVDGNDLRGANRLLVDAVTGTTDLVEAVHASILGWPRRVIGLAPKPDTGGIPGLAYNGVRGIARLAGSGIDRLLRRMPNTRGEMDRHPQREALIAALNGVLGDHLVATDNPLALTATLRMSGRPLVLDRDALAISHPDAGAHLLVMVHGLCMNDLQWQQGQHHHGDTLADELGFQVIHLYYNSGLSIADNGRIFSALLQQLVDAWPVLVERIAILAHSMGGLVSRAAIAAAQADDSRWLRTLDTLVSLGTPHLGAPLERAGDLLQTVLGISAHSAPFTALGGLRSAGIQDLRHGSLLVRHPPLPAHVRAYAVAASTQPPRSDGTAHGSHGDGLVPVASAFGDHEDPALGLGIPDEYRLLVHRTGHIGLLASTKVRKQLRDWLG